MECESEICNLLQSDPPSFNPSLISASSYKREWDEYFNYDFDIKSINNGIAKSSSKLEEYFQDLQGIDLRMSNPNSFSFQLKETGDHLQSESKKSDYLITVENVNFNTEEDPFENDELFTDNIKPFINYNEIAEKFVKNIFIRAQKEDLIEPCDSYKDLVDIDKLEKRYEAFLNYKNNTLKREIESKEEEIEKLNDKLSKCKYQNQIVIEENKKLLEIIHLFKLMNEIDKKKRGTEEERSDDEINIDIDTNDINLKDINIEEFEKLINIKNSDYFKDENSENKENSIKNNEISQNSKNLENFISTPKKENKVPKQNTKSTRNRSSNYTTNSYSHNKKGDLSSDYSNSYLFKEKKCYITIATPSSYKKDSANIKKSKSNANIKKKKIPPLCSYKNLHCQIPSINQDNNPFSDVEHRLALFANQDNKENIFEEYDNKKSYLPYKNISYITDQTQMKTNYRQHSNYTKFYDINKSNEYQYGNNNDNYDNKGVNEENDDILLRLNQYKQTSEKQETIRKASYGTNSTVAGSSGKRKDSDSAKREYIEQSPKDPEIIPFYLIDKEKIYKNIVSSSSKKKSSNSIKIPHSKGKTKKKINF